MQYCCWNEWNNSIITFSGSSKILSASRPSMFRKFYQYLNANCVFLYTYRRKIHSLWGFQPFFRAHLFNEHNIYGNMKIHTSYIIFSHYITICAYPLLLSSILCFREISKLKLTLIDRESGHSWIYSVIKL